jgi:hypothetical protein
LSGAGYFEGRNTLTKEDMDRCLVYYHDNLKPKLKMAHNPDAERDCLMRCLNNNCRCPQASCLYELTHPPRTCPESPTSETKWVYDMYERDRQADLARHYSTERHSRSRCCDIMNMRKFSGTSGLCFCTQDMDQCAAHHKREPAGKYGREELPNAAEILRVVLGPPPDYIVVDVESSGPVTDQPEEAFPVAI